MQAVKDTFYMTLRERLASANPQRTFGEDHRPAILVCENEPDSQSPFADVFYLRWSSAEKLPDDAAAAGWHALRGEIAYRTGGTASANGEDRGRLLSVLDDELASILHPRQALLFDYSQDPPRSLGGTLLWTEPVFEPSKDNDGIIARTAHVSILWQEGARA